ncbi:hypothetical protein BpHYR1_044048 [Brachionus plicatilis]|uniref:Uncharacterized protein n=1 Tax=Brachionus plicatilis TaxID=10195 RepID=A0A3M7SE54_BRAPC|nr:hypothetical protein BpHYR1_044048 [Brachionus plicatilis]
MYFELADTIILKFRKKKKSFILENLNPISVSIFFQHLTWLLPKKVFFEFIVLILQVQGDTFIFLGIKPFRYSKIDFVLTDLVFFIITNKYKKLRVEQNSS